MPVRADQAQLAEGLQRQFPPEIVRLEWAALSGGAAVYSPRVDIAVGPFAIDDLRFDGEYNRMGKDSHALLAAIHSHFERNVRNLDDADRIPSLGEVIRRNSNARCFLAIEIEATGSRKHVMGGAVNAAALGRIGLSVACDNKRLKVLLKTRRYLRFLTSVGKNSFDVSNLMILTTHQLAEVLDVELLGV